jgi:hypothetical protein
MEGRDFIIKICLSLALRGMHLTAKAQRRRKAGERKNYTDEFQRGSYEGWNKASRHCISLRLCGFCIRFLHPVSAPGRWRSGDAFNRKGAKEAQRLRMKFMQMVFNVALMNQLDRQ